MDIIFAETVVNKSIWNNRYDYKEEVKKYLCRMLGERIYNDNLFQIDINESDISPDCLNIRVNVAIEER